VPPAGCRTPDRDQRAEVQFMKMLIKYYLVWGFGLSFLALMARRLAEISEPGLPEPPDPAAKSSRHTKSADAPDPAAAPPSGPASASHLSAPVVTLCGTVVRVGGLIALCETAGALYPLNPPGRAWSFEGKKVRASGAIDLDTHTLHVDSIVQAAL
jgi:hypothetical protein